MSKKDYIGLALDSDDLKVADLQFHKRKLVLQKLTKTTFSSKKEKQKKKPARKKEEVASDSDALFGIGGSTSKPEMEEQDQSFEVLDDLDILSMTDNVNGIDDEGASDGNENVLFHIIAGINAKQVQLGLNISSGSALFQILKDEDFSVLKPKQVKEIVEDKLRSIYDQDKSSDQYAYDIREDGSLMLISIEKNPELLDMVEKGQVFYSGKTFINKILPDEAAILGLTRANYNLRENEVTGIVLFGMKSTRLIFLKGEEITAISPIISEGIHSKGILKTVFSKILLQLDSGVLPSLDRLIIANNMLGEECIDYLADSFPDITVEEFHYHPDKFNITEDIEEDIAPFTTAIAMAWAASGADAPLFNTFDFVPEYVKERQKVFKLEWHGVILLCLIAITPIVFNHYYQKNKDQIHELTVDINRTDNVLNQIHSTVVGTQYLAKKYQITDAKLGLLQKISSDSYKWRTILNHLNRGTDLVHGIWITSMRKVSNGIALDGYSLSRNQIPVFAATFDDALLQNVIIQPIREHNVNKFTMVISQVVQDSTIYSPH